MTNQHPDLPPEEEADEAREDADEPSRATLEGLGRPDLGEQRDTGDRRGTDEADE